MKFIPRTYQRFCIDRIVNQEKCALLLEMGLGKTISTLIAINKLINLYEEISKVLIIAPKRVCLHTWPDEIKKWDDVKDLKYSIVIGSPLARIEALEADADIYLINRENVEWLFKYLASSKHKMLFDMIVVDEASSFKSSASKRFKALRKMTRLVDRVVLLTGTPTPNGLMDLWSQIFLIDEGERLGKTLSQYRYAFFTPGRRNGYVVYNWIPNDDAESRIYDLISDIAVSMKSVDHLEMPERIFNNIVSELDDESMKLYKKLSKDFIIKYKDEIIKAPTSGVLNNKLLQLANGALYNDKKEFIVVHNHKLQMLEEILEENPSNPVLVFYNYKSDYERINSYFRGKGVTPKTLDEPNAFEEWNEGKIRMLLANPASMGHGLNMQQGGHIIVWFGLTYNLEYYQQANARLYRQGQKNSVVINHLVMAGTIDEIVLANLDRKDSMQQALMDYVKAEIERMG